jgi:phage FluMu gp28-like protein
MSQPAPAVETLPPVLLSYQQAWIADKATVKLWEKSRRIGASWTQAGESALEAASARSAGGMDQWYIGYNQDMAREFIEDSASWSRHYNLAAEALEEFVFREVDEHGDTREIQAYRIHFASGFKIVALSSKPRNLRGKQGRIIIDEAAFHDDLPGLMKAALALLIWGGRVVVLSSHNGEDNPFNALIQDSRAKKRSYSVHRTPFLEAVEAGLYRRVCLRTGRPWDEDEEVAWVARIYKDYGEDAEEELDCVPSKGSGTFLSRAIIAACMADGIPVLRLEKDDAFTLRPERERVSEIDAWCEDTLLPLLEALPKGLAHGFGEDFARTGDLTVIYPLQQQMDLKLAAPFVVELRNVPFEQQKQILFYVVDRLPRFAAGALDARGNGQYLAEVSQQRYGSARIQQVMLSEAWYRENMPRFRAVFQDQGFVLPKDADHLDDLRQIKMQKGVAKVPDTAKTTGADGKGRHGDAAIALALAEFAMTQMEPAPIEFQAAPAARGRWDASPSDGFSMRPVENDFPELEEGAW